MTSERFAELLQARLKSISDVLSLKAHEYSNSDDRLHNFKRAARLGETTPEHALKGMLLKHLVSVFDLIDKPPSRTEYLINEKIGDAINYLILLEALFYE